MTVRRATYDDIPRIMEICGEARSIMRADGNMNQWTNGYPSEDAIRADIDRGVAYIIESAANHRDEPSAIGVGRRNPSSSETVGYFAFIPGTEPTYLEIEGGEWLDESGPYCTIHRLASTVSSRGVAETCFSWCWERCCNLRIDTHEDNRIMRHCIEKFGFTYCGVIHLLNGDPRLAYQKVRTREPGDDAGAAPSK